MKKCCFAGHSKIYAGIDLIYNMVKDKSKELIIKKGVKEFWAGNYGAFDHIAPSAVRELKKIYLDIPAKTQKNTI